MRPVASWTAKTGISEAERQAVKDYIVQVWDEKMVKTIECESGYNLNAVGDHGTSLGLYQIHMPAHPSVTRECAFDLQCSTAYAKKLYERRGLAPWSCATKLGFR